MQTKPGPEEKHLLESQLKDAEDKLKAVGQRYRATKKKEDFDEAARQTFRVMTYQQILGLKVDAAEQMDAALDPLPAVS